MSGNSDINRGVEKEYRIGSGRVEFNLFPVQNGIAKPDMAKGYAYLGVSKEVKLSVNNETLEHEISECGQSSVDERIPIKSELTGSMVLETISKKNLAMFFAGSVENVTQAAKNNVVEIIKVYRGLGYRLGVTDQNPTGVFDAEMVSVKTFADEAAAKANNSPVATLEAGKHYELHEKQAYFIVADHEDVSADGVWVRVEYNLRQSMRDVVITKGQSVTGSLMFRDCNNVGEDRYWVLPQVRITANGDFDLKSSDWASLSFDITAMQLGNKAMMYINGIPQK